MTVISLLDYFDQPIQEHMHNRFSDRSFTASGPHMWNTLRNDLRRAEWSCEHFKRQLKTYLCTDHGAV